MRDAVAAERARARNASRRGGEGRGGDDDDGGRVTVAFVDTYHMSLGLHWAGHGSHDAVHFHPSLYSEFAAATMSAIRALCP